MHLMPHADPQPPPRRGAGELEAAVLSVLWQAGRALSPGEVQQALAGPAGAAAPELSYSTVVTILSRLHAKKVLDRRRDGRAFRYAPVADEAELAGRRRVSPRVQQAERAGGLRPGCAGPDRQGDAVPHAPVRHDAHAGR